MDREVWRAAIHGVRKSRTRVSDWTELNWWILKQLMNVETMLKQLVNFSIIGRKQPNTTSKQMGVWLCSNKTLFIKSGIGLWWWTGRSGVLRFMRSQRVGHDWATDLIWSDLDWFSTSIKHLLSDPAPCISFCPGHSFPLPISLTSWHSWLIHFLHALS